MKDYLKVIVTVVITFLATSFLNALINKSAATQKDLLIVEKKAYEYTDKEILQHEEKDKYRYDAIMQRFEGQKELINQRFDDLEKRLN